MMLTALIAVFYLSLSASKVQVIALPLFMAALFNMALWASYSSIGVDLFLISAVLLELATVFLMMILAKLETRKFIVDGIFRQGILLIIAATSHVLQLIDINEGTNLVYDNYQMLIDLIIILQILSLGVTMYGDLIRENWAFLRDNFASLSRSWKSNSLLDVGNSNLGNTNQVNKLAKIKNGFEK